MVLLGWGEQWADEYWVEVLKKEEKEEAGGSHAVKEKKKGFERGSCADTVKGGRKGEQCLEGEVAPNYGASLLPLPC